MKKDKAMPSLFKVRHSIRGRIRLTVLSREDIEKVATAARTLKSVVLVRVNSACKSVIINYDAAKIEKNALLQKISSLAPASSSADEAVCTAGPSLSVCSCAAPARVSPVKKQFARFLYLTGVTAYVFVKEVLLKGIVSQTLFSPLGMITLVAALPLLKESWQHLKEKRFTLEGFLAAGCIAATAAGQAVTALEILWIQSGAETLNAWVAERSRQSVSQILELTAKNTFILVGDVEVEIPVSAVKPRDIVVLHTGEKVSVDGEVIFGEALVDDSPITGRAELAHVVKGQEVYAGSYVHQGIIHVRAACVGDKTYLARIMRQVEDSMESRAPIESVADQLAKNMVRLGFLATGATLLFTGSLWRAFTVMLVMACPCATVLSAQTAVSAAMSAAAKRGILIKGGRYLEEVSRADSFCFDKTGTLTSNQPRIEAIVNFSALSENELLMWAYSAEMHNHHPLAQAIRQEALHRKIDPISHTECDFTLGKGVRAVIGGSNIRLGNRRYMEESGIGIAEAVKKVSKLQQRGLTVVFLARDKEVLAALAFANEPRPDAAATVAALRAGGVKEIAMITGDSENTALDLCRSLEIDTCRHSVLPEEKGKIVAELRSGGKKVVMVGDGINDALALAEADIGIAMSASGADVAIEAADIVLVHDDLDDILYVRNLGKRTLSVAKQNFWLATSTNIGGAIAGALGVLSPVAAGLLHIVHTLGVLANSSRLLLPGKIRRDADTEIKALPQGSCGHEAGTETSSAVAEIIPAKMVAVKAASDKKPPKKAAQKKTADSQAAQLKSKSGKTPRSSQKTQRKSAPKKAVQAPVDSANTSQ